VYVVPPSRSATAGKDIATVLIKCCVGGSINDEVLSELENCSPRKEGGKRREAVVEENRLERLSEGYLYSSEGGPRDEVVEPHCCRGNAGVNGMMASGRPKGTGVLEPRMRIEVP